MAYEQEIKVVEAAIAALKQEEDPTLMVELEAEQLTAATGLELYGITKSVFERFLRERALKKETRAYLEVAADAVRRIYTS